jgi:thioesterase domain-containing protein
VTVSLLLDELRRRDVRVWADGDQLRCNAPAGTLTPELRGQLQARKSEILGFLQSAKALADQQRAVVPLQPLGTRPPVFAVAGHNGDVFCYRAMAQRLGTDQPFFGLQAPGADGQSDPLTSVEDIAAYFASQILAFRPNGPYLLAGYCAGGTIAFELARQLSEGGATVPLVALFASPHPKWYRRVPQMRHRLARQIDRIGTHARAFASLTPSQRRSYFSDKLRARRAQHHAERAAPPDPLLLLRAQVEAATLRAVRRYTPRHFRGRVTLFLPSRDWLRYRSALLRWRSMADEIDVRCGPDGCPDTGMLLEPDVAISTELFRRCCEKSDADTAGELDYAEAADASARSA